MLTNSAQQTLNDYRKKTISCQCLKVEKPQVKYINPDGSGWINCEGAECKKIISSAGHHRTIRNRNDPRFWGLEVKEKVLCLKCLGNLTEKMPVSRRYTFNKYVKRGYE